MTKVDVAIVGAGFSGLSAALDLRDAGQDLLVLEAQNRPCGRVWTVISMVLACLGKDQNALTPESFDAAVALAPSVRNQTRPSTKPTT